MSLLQEIHAWSQSLAPWQSDALARLLARPELEAADQADLLALLKSTHGIEDAHKREPCPLQAGQIPEPVKADTLVLLHAIRDFKHVNAIAEGQSLPIGGSNARSSFLPTTFTSCTCWSMRQRNGTSPCRPKA